MRDSKERFSDRVADYVRFRPGYPEGVSRLLVEQGRVGPGRVVVDLGSGTGILSAMALATGAEVIGVEPNGPMRVAAEQALAGEPRFRSCAGSAEATGLPDACADVALAGQAFHWFDPARTRRELARILRKPGWVALAWNMRASTPFNDAYEAMLMELAPEYPAVQARDRIVGRSVQEFFAPGPVHEAHFPNAQRFDHAGLRGRLMSSSYAPAAGTPGHGPILARLDRIFEEHASAGEVEIAYDTVVYWGSIETFR